MTCCPWEGPTTLGPVCLVGATDRTTVRTWLNRWGLTLILPSRPFILGTTSSTSPKLFTRRTRPNRLSTLPRLNPLLRSPWVSLLVRPLLTRRLVPLTKASILFTLRTWEVTCLGRKILRLLSPLFTLVNPTGRLAMVCMSTVVLLWALLLSPARTMLATFNVLPKSRVMPIVLRLGTVLIISKTLVGPMADPTPPSLLTSRLLTRKWLVALRSIQLPLRLPVRVIVPPVTAIGPLAFTRNIGIFVPLFIIRSRLTVVGWHML